MIKKIFTILLFATALVSCVGPQGPMGPQGEPGEGLNWKVYDMTVNSNDWELINGENGNKLGSYFMYVFEGDQAPKELEYVTKYDGDVSGYFMGRLDNGDEVYSPLPYEIYQGDSDGNNQWIWSELYTFDFTHNSIAFYVYYNDFETGIRPGTMKFRMSFKW